MNHSAGGSVRQEKKILSWLSTISAAHFPIIKKLFITEQWDLLKGGRRVGEFEENSEMLCQFWGSPQWITIIDQPSLINWLPTSVVSLSQIQRRPSKQKSLKSTKRCLGSNYHSLFSWQCCGEWTCASLFFAAVCCCVLRCFLLHKLFDVLQKTIAFYLKAFGKCSLSLGGCNLTNVFLAQTRSMIQNDWQLCQHSKHREGL